MNHPDRKTTSLFSLRHPAGIALSYVGVSIAWIVLSDWLLMGWVDDKLTMTRMQMLKGGLYISFTSVLIYVLVRNSQASLQATNAELHEERAILESLFAALPDTFYAFDREGDFRRWNEQMARVSGYSEEEIEGMHPLHFITERHRGRVREAIERVFAEHEPVTVEAEMLTKEGEAIPYEFTGAELRDREGQAMGLVGIGRDLRKRRERQRQFRAIFNQTYQFTALLSPEGDVLEVNETMLAFGGVRRSEVVGRPFWKTYGLCRSKALQEAVQSDMRRAAEGAFVRRELQLEGADRRAIVDFSLKPVLDEVGEVELLIAEGRDITARKELEQENAQISRQERQWFAQELHDGLCQQLSSLSVRLAALQSSVAEDDPVHERLKRIKGLTDRTIREARALSHGITPVDFEEESFVKELDQLVDETASAYQISCTLQVDEAGNRVCAQTASNLYRITQEALSNAIRHGACSSIRVTLAVEKEALVLRIKDDGVGIGGASTRAKSGIGLETMQRRARMIGADLTVRNCPEGGTVVACSVPVSSEASASAARIV